MLAEVGRENVGLAGRRGDAGRWISLDRGESYSVSRSEGRRKGRRGRRGSMLGVGRDGVEGSAVSDTVMSGVAASPGEVWPVLSLREGSGYTTSGQASE
jgi:hypothetical protein